MTQIQIDLTSDEIESIRNMNMYPCPVTGGFLDASRQRLWRAKQIGLAPKEIKVLLNLLEKVGVVLPELSDLADRIRGEE